MMKIAVSVLVSLMGCLVRVNCWPHGAPASACDSLRPSHHQNQPQDTQSPYSILIEQPTYTPGKPLTISLVASGNKHFLGLLLETREVDESGNYGGYIGKLNPAEGTSHIHGCGNATLTHKDSGKKSFTNLTVTWTAPVDATRSFVARATFVQSFSTFWTDVTSPVIRPAKEHSITSAGVIPGQKSIEHAERKPNDHAVDGRFVFPKAANKISTTTTRTPLTTTEQLTHSPNVSLSRQEDLCQNVTAVFHTDVECERSKGCFVSCDSYSCDYVVSWVSRAESVEFEITARTAGTGDQWVAIGFSYDIEMGDDSVVECISEGEVVSVHQSFNYVYYNTQLDKPYIGLSETQGCLQNGIFRCKFTRQKAITEDEQIQDFDLNKPWVIMFANGETRDGIKQMHTLSPKYGPWTSGVSVNFDEFVLVGKGAGSRLLISLHGCFMVVAWVIFASVGILVARYYREEWSSASPFGQKVWFLIHRTSLVTAFTLVVTSFFIIYEESNRAFGPVKNGYATGKLYEAVHPTLGIVTVVFTFINPIMAIFRPSPDAERRPWFNWAHRCIGIFTAVIAYFTIAFGLGMEKVGAPQFSLYVMLGFGVYQLAVAMTLEIWDCLIKQDDNDTPGLQGGKPEYQTLIDKQGFKSQETEGSWDLLTWKTILFYGNSLIVVAIGIFLIVLISADFSKKFHG